MQPVQRITSKFSPLHVLNTTIPEFIVRQHNKRSETAMDTAYNAGEAGSPGGSEKVPVSMSTSAILAKNTAVGGLTWLQQSDVYIVFVN
jgi:hypothetical protein